METFVAIGDSFTEGLEDQAPGGGFRGWADMVTAALAAQRPGFRYANLAIRGKLPAEVVAEQVFPVIRLLRGRIAAGSGSTPARGRPVASVAAPAVTASRPSAPTCSHSDPSPRAKRLDTEACARLR
jgi:hypothetical protein